MLSFSFGKQAIHPAIIRVGLEYSQGYITGSDARCLALLDALCHLIKDISTPKDKEFPRHFESKLKQSVK